jgi:acylphosphatase
MAVFNSSTEASSPQTERRVVHYSGRVQGVGFRYSARQTAERFAVTGFVRNLSDGRVHLVTEGAAAELTAFLDELAAQMGRNIRHADARTEPATGEFSRFEIRF